MFGKYTLVLVTHFACTAVILKILSLVLPCCVTNALYCAGHFLTFLLVAGFTFRYTKKKHLNDKLPPENRAILITGCDTGFGFMLAKHLDTQGFPVFASCLNPTGADAAELIKSCSKRLQIVGLDVTSDESVKKAFEFVKENLGPSELWAIINNAGIHKGFTIELTSIEDFKESVEVNTLGPVRVTKVFLPLLRQTRGRVINLTSILGRIPVPHTSPYVISKFATAGFNDCLRQELDSWGIRVISVEPELFETPISRGDRISSCVNSMLQSLDDNVKADYGENYLKSFRIYAEYQMRMSSPKVHQVISALEEAVSMEYPDVVYRPCRNCLVECILHIYELLPHTVKDIIIKFIFYITGFPKPKEAR